MGGNARLLNGWWGGRADQVGIIGNGASFSPLEVTRLHTDFSHRLRHILYINLIIFALIYIHRGVCVCVFIAYLEPVWGV